MESSNQLPREPPVLIIFLPPPLDLAAPGLGIKREFCAPGTFPFFPPLLLFLLFTGNDIPNDLMSRYEIYSYQRLT